MFEVVIGESRVKIYDLDRVKYYEIEGIDVILKQIDSHYELIPKERFEKEIKPFFEWVIR